MPSVDWSQSKGRSKVLRHLSGEKGVWEEVERGGHRGTRKDGEEDKRRQAVSTVTQSPGPDFSHTFPGVSGANSFPRAHLFSFLVMKSRL